PWFGVLAAVSFGVSLIGLFGHKDWAFYSPLARAWELLAGGILAGTHLSSRRFAIPENLASVSGLLAIFGSALALDNSSPFPGPYALLPVIGAVLMIASPNSLLNPMFCRAGFLSGSASSAIRSISGIGRYCPISRSCGMECRIFWRSGRPSRWP